MSLILREVADYDIANATKYVANFNTSKNKINENLEYVKDQFYVYIEAMHLDMPTENSTRYMTEAARKSQESWTKPYNIPVIMYHNDYDGTVVGRVLEASINASTLVNNNNCLLLKTSAPNWRTKEDIMNGVLKTVSIGTEATDVRCSICGQQLANGETCEHSRGMYYEGELCTWDVYDFQAKELSYVIIPSDKYAQVIDIKDNDNFYTTPAIPAEKGSIRTREQQKKGVRSVNLQEQLDAKAKEAEQLTVEKNSLVAERDALKGDKINLTESITTLNKDKVELQKQLKEFKTKLEASITSVESEKQLKEAAESKISELEKEVKMSLVESLSSLRSQAKKPELSAEELSKRSIDSLRDAVSDLKTELKELKLKELKGGFEDPSLNSQQAKAGDPKQKIEDYQDINFSL